MPRGRIYLVMEFADSVWYGVFEILKVFPKGPRLEYCHPGPDWDTHFIAETIGGGPVCGGEQQD